MGPSAVNPILKIDNATVFREACKRFLPTTRQEMQWRGWSELDVLLISGDAYVDHPTFGIPCLGRWLEKMGSACRYCLAAQVAVARRSDGGLQTNGSAKTFCRRLVRHRRQHDQQLHSEQKSSLRRHVLRGRHRRKTPRLRQRCLCQTREHRVSRNSRHRGRRRSQPAQTRAL